MAKIHTVEYSRRSGYNGTLGVTITSLIIRPPLEDVGPGFAAAVVGSYPKTGTGMSYVGSTSKESVFTVSVPEAPTGGNLAVVAERTGRLANDLTLAPIMQLECPFSDLTQPPATC